MEHDAPREGWMPTCGPSLGLSPGAGRAACASEVLRLAPLSFLLSASLALRRVPHIGANCHSATPVACCCRPGLDGSRGEPRPQGLLRRPVAVGGPRWFGVRQHLRGQAVPHLRHAVVRVALVGCLGSDRGRGARAGGCRGTRAGGAQAGLERRWPAWRQAAACRLLCFYARPTCQPPHIATSRRAGGGGAGATPRKPAPPSPPGKIRKYLFFFPGRHPEKNAFEWTPDKDIPHHPDAIEITQVGRNRNHARGLLCRPPGVGRAPGSTAGCLESDASRAGLVPRRRRRWERPPATRTRWRPHV